MNYSDELLKKYIDKIEPVSLKYYQACVKRFDGVAKPLGGLGRLEELVARIGSIQRTTDVDISNRRVLVCCSDNGVVKHGVSQSDSSVTQNIARSLVAGTASVSIMAKNAGAIVEPIDMGMNESVAGTIDRHIMRGCNDICEGPAMNRMQVLQAIITGIEEVGRCKEEHVDIICTGEAGIGNTTTSAAIASVIFGKEVNLMVGRGAGLSDDGVIRKISAIEKAILINKPDKSDVIDVLSKVGGADIAGMAGIFLGGAYYHIPIVMDGVISSVAAIVAYYICKDVSGYIIPSHMSSEIAMKYVCEELGLTPVIDGAFHLGEGTGAVAILPLIDMAIRVYYDAARFDDIGVEQYTKQ